MSLRHLEFGKFVCKKATLQKCILAGQKRSEAYVECHDKATRMIVGKNL